MTSIRLENIKKTYGNTVVMENINFDIIEGERLVLLGPSGCGKSTILRMIAGFEEITEGSLYFDTQIVNDLKPGERNIAMVFQNYALYPHMTVYENITYGLKAKKIPQNEINQKVDEVANVLDLTKYLDRKPAELSGGQRQRVALARATVKNSPIFLLDEPLSNLDAKLRVTARESLLEIHERYKHTMVYVTHDQTEAMTFGTRIALLNSGEIQQIDEPHNIYLRPNNIFTATFIGNPPMNVIKESSVENNKLFIGNQYITLKENWASYLSDYKKRLFVGIRPESCLLHREEKTNTFRGIVNRIENYGYSYVYYVEVESETIAVMSQFNLFDEKDTVYIEFVNDLLSFFDADTTNNVGYPTNILNKMDAVSKSGIELENLIKADNH